MTTNESQGGCILRAELYSSGGTVVSYARELTERTVFVVTDCVLPLDTLVVLRISLPTLIAPVEVRARVAELRAANGIGDPAGIKLVFDFESPESAEAIARAVARVTSGRDERTTLREYRVLLVEDNAFIRDMFAYGIARFFAQRRGSVVFDHAADAADAWAKLPGGTYDLIIVDYYLPAEDGASFIAKLRRDARFERAPVVAISVGGRDAREATISAGADLFLDKPIVLRDLFDTLQVLSQQGAIA